MHDLYRNNISRNWKSGVRSEISRGRNLLKYEFCNKSFRKNEPLTSWTLFSPLIKTLGERASNFENTYVEKSVQLVKGSSFRNDLLQNPYFSTAFKVLLINFKNVIRSDWYNFKPPWYMVVWFISFVFSAVLSNRNQRNCNLKNGIFETHKQDDDIKFW